jgi:hypothetical protein
MVFTSFSMTKFIEKRGITERFGLQRNNALGLLAIVYFGLTVVYYFNINNFHDIFFAPLYEEIFFRGFILGMLSQHNNNEWKWISLTSFFFASGHVFTYYPAFPANELAGTIGTTFVGGLFFGFLYVRLRTILWCFLVHILHNLFPAYRLPMLIVSMLIILVAHFLRSLDKKRRETAQTPYVQQKVG